MKTLYSCFTVLFFLTATYAQSPAIIPVAANLVVDGVPALPASLVEEVKPYTEARSAVLLGWPPTKKQLLINNRFSNTGQVHQVAMPEGGRKQLTFFNESPREVSYQPTTGGYFLLTKDIGGNEFTQIYRYDFSTGKPIQINDSTKAQNGNIVWNKNGTKILYTSTRRNSTDRDLYMMDPLHPSSDKKLLEVQGGGWTVDAQSSDEHYALLENTISINESSLWLYDFTTGEKTKLLPQGNERVVYSGIQFSRNGKSIYILTNVGSEFLRPARVDLNTKKVTYPVTGINWDIPVYQVSRDEKIALFIVNEAGVSKLYTQDMATLKYKPVSAVPVDVIDPLQWHNNSKSLAFTFTTSNASADVYEWNTETQKLTCQTESELGGMNLSGIDPPQLIKWKSFDGREISGFLYKANKKFTGKRPVIINVHCGPEGQALPTFLSRSNYYLNELGVSLIYPNVRGSTGYGKTFTDLDNGLKREESVQDIGALIDWIGTQSALDASRIMITEEAMGAI